MGHKTLIGGTAYDIKGGKTLIGGTAYDIKAGKTLIGGTGYDISFAPVPTLAALFASATLEKSNGRNSSSTSTVTISTDIPIGTSYLLSFCNGYMSTYKVTKAENSNPVLTGLSVSTASYGKAMVSSNGAITYSANGTGSTSTRSATLALFTFSAYTDTQREALLTFTPTRLAGRNTSTTGTVTSTINTSTTFYAFATYSSQVGFSKISNGTITNIYGNNTTNPSLLYLNGTTLGVSLNGSSNAAVFGASLIAIGG